MTSRESAGVTLSLEFRIDFSSVLRVKCNITVISLLFGKYIGTFVPRFPGIPLMLYFPPPSASGNITSRGFPGTSGQTFWYISLKVMKYLYNIKTHKIRPHSICIILTIVWIHKRCHCARSNSVIVVKLLACGERGPGFDSQSRSYAQSRSYVFRNWLSPASKSRYSWNISKAT